MTYHVGPCLKPKVGEFYRLRAGLAMFCCEQAVIGGIPYWKGLLMDGAAGVFLWYENGNYCPTYHAHELDVMFIDLGGN